MGNLPLRFIRWGESRLDGTAIRAGFEVERNGICTVGRACFPVSRGTVGRANAVRFTRDVS